MSAEKPTKKPWTREERAELALHLWKPLFTEPQWQAAIKQIVNQLICHVEYDLPKMAQQRRDEFAISVICDGCGLLQQGQWIVREEEPTKPILVIDKHVCPSTLENNGSLIAALWGDHSRNMNWPGIAVGSRKTPEPVVSGSGECGGNRASYTLEDDTAGLLFMAEVPNVVGIHDAINLKYMYVAFHMPMFGTPHIDSKPMECATCPRGASMGANDWKDRDISTCNPGDKFECARCGTKVEIMWGLDEPDHLSNWMNAEYCPHRLCKLKYKELMESKANAKESTVKQEHGPLPAEAGESQEAREGAAG